MKLGLENKVALVTGGNSGIGRATALMFAEEGARVVIAARDAARGHEVASEIAALGGDCTFIKTDMESQTDIKALFDKTIEKYGRLDCAVNNAGCLHQGEFIHTSEKDWNWVMNVNLKSIWLCMQHEIRHMLEIGGGSIVNVSSVAGLVGYPQNSIYCASKHGVLGLTRSSSAEYAARKIRINTICPGWVDTPMSKDATSSPEMLEIAKSLIPMGRIGEPDELAATAVFMCSDRASFISGICLGVDGGATQH